LDCRSKKKEMNPKKEKNETERAKETAFRFLSYRPRSSAEVRRKLEEGAFSPLTITAALGRAEELGYLNDDDFAYSFAHASLEKKQWGTLRIHDALLKRGVAQSVIDQALKRLAEEYDLTTVARRALENRCTSKNRQQKGEKTRQKAVSYLRRKGFCWETISAVLAADDKP